MKILTLLLHDERFSGWTLEEKVSRYHFSLQYLGFCRQKGWESLLYTFHQQVGVMQLRRLAGGGVVKIFPVKLRFPPFQLFGNDHNPELILKEAIADAPDLVHFHNYYLFSYPYTAFFVKKKLRRPLVAQLHSYLDNSPRRSVYMPCLLALRQADRILYSYEPEKTLYRELGVTQKTVKIPIPGVDPQVFRPQKREPSNHLLYVGRIPRPDGAYAEKSPFLLLHLLRKLLRLRRDVVLDLVGDGPGLHHCRETANRLGLGNNIVFHGYVPREDLPKYYQASDLTLSPIRVYDVDGWFDGAIQESLACGTPVAAFKSSPNTPLHGTYGCLLSNDPQKASSEVASLLKTPGIMDEATENGSKFVRENCSLDKVADRLRKTWEDAIRK